MTLQLFLGKWVSANAATLTKALLCVPNSPRSSVSIGISTMKHLCSVCFMWKDKEETKQMKMLNSKADNTHGLILTAAIFPLLLVCACARLREDAGSCGFFQVLAIKTQFVTQSCIMWNYKVQNSNNKVQSHRITNQPIRAEEASWLRSEVFPKIFPYNSSPSSPHPL